MNDEAPRYFRVRNFERFQHYRDRRPPWIKLWTSILDDYDFWRLSDEQKWHLVGIFLLASQHDNKLPWTPDYIGSQIRSKTPVDLDQLLHARFIEEISDDYKEPSCDWSSRYIPPQVRAEVLRRNGQCFNCGSAQDLEIDHVIPISKGGKSTKDNLQVLCRKCNRTKRFYPAQELPVHMRRKSLRRTSASAQAGLSQKGRPETETETEKESEAKPETEKAPASLRSRPVDETFEVWATAFSEARSVPYQSKKADFIRLAALRKACGLNGRGEPQQWRKAIANYLASPLPAYTLADLCSRYDQFVNGEVDRFGRPAGLFDGQRSLHDQSQAAVNRFVARGKP